MNATCPEGHWITPIRKISSLGISESETSGFYVQRHPEQWPVL